MLHSVAADFMHEHGAGSARLDAVGKQVDPVAPHEALNRLAFGSICAHRLLQALWQLPDVLQHSDAVGHVRHELGDLGQHALDGAGLGVTGDAELGAYAVGN